MRRRDIPATHIQLPRFHRERGPGERLRHTVGGVALSILGIAVGAVSAFNPLDLWYLAPVALIFIAYSRTRSDHPLTKVLGAIGAATALYTLGWFVWYKW